jgi:hypothetical protein
MLRLEALEWKFFSELANDCSLQTNPMTWGSESFRSMSSHMEFFLKFLTDFSLSATQTS